MNVSIDGVMVNLLEEGWKEVKLSAISAVEPTVDEATGEIEVRLTHHSYRAGFMGSVCLCQAPLGRALSPGLKKSQAPNECQ